MSADWYDYEAKYEPGGMELVIPARLPDAQLEEVRRLAVEVFKLIDCSGMARVDFFVEDGAVLVNELNTIPGFTATSVYAKLWEASGLPYVELLDRLLALALERHAGGAPLPLLALRPGRAAAPRSSPCPRRAGARRSRRGSCGTPGRWPRSSWNTWRSRTFSVLLTLSQPRSEPGTVLEA